MEWCPRCGHELHTLHSFCRCGCTYAGAAVAPVQDGVR